LWNKKKSKSHNARRHKSASCKNFILFCILLTLCRHLSKYIYTICCRFFTLRRRNKVSILVFSILLHISGKNKMACSFRVISFRCLAAFERIMCYVLECVNVREFKVQTYISWPCTEQRMNKLVKQFLVPFYSVHYNYFITDSANRTSPHEKIILFLRIVST
jgi:hypothetical protein